MMSRRAQEMTLFSVMDVLEKANEMERAGVHIIHLQLGEPDFDTPRCVKEPPAGRLREEGMHRLQHYLEKRD